MFGDAALRYCCYQLQLCLWRAFSCSFDQQQTAASWFQRQKRLIENKDDATPRMGFAGTLSAICQVGRCTAALLLQIDICLCAA
jgi:hypothetical protein